MSSDPFLGTTLSTAHAQVGSFLTVLVLLPLAASATEPERTVDITIERKD